MYFLIYQINTVSFRLTNSRSRSSISIYVSAAAASSAKTPTSGVVQDDENHVVREASRPTKNSLPSPSSGSGAAEPSASEAVPAKTTTIATPPPEKDELSGSHEFEPPQRTPSPRDEVLVATDAAAPSAVTLKDTDGASKQLFLHPLEGEEAAVELLFEK